MSDISFNSTVPQVNIVVTLAGLNGRDGVDGKDGLNGRDGIDGAPGQNGTNGQDGVDGAPGRDGIDGTPGRDGTDGQDGIGITAVAIDERNHLIVRTTAYPSRYADEEWVDEEVQAEEPSVGKFRLRIDLMKSDCRYYISGAQHQKQLAALLGAAMGAKPVYERKNKYYTVGDWYVIASCGGSVSVGSGLFDIDEAEKNLRVLNALHDAGYVPDETVDIFFTPDVYDLKLVLNLCNIMEARNKLIVQALGLDEEIQIVVDESLAFGIPLSAFSFEKIEACVYLLRQASLMAANTDKARMKPCDGSNPKYQMRTWLLRLGFIGDQYARPRQTLLNGLDGDGAFFSDDGKEKAAMKRKSKRMAG